MITLRKSAERGHSNHGWLDSFHSFSFAAYHDPSHVSFGPLRVINEDRILAGSGFGTHGHKDTEIITYVLEGELTHMDSIGTGSVIKPGDVQRMSAGTGVKHSEFNHSQVITHLLQIWIQPDTVGIAPSYEEKKFVPCEKKGRLRLIASPDGREGSVSMQQNAYLYAGLFDDMQEAKLLLSPGRLAYVHVVKGEIIVNGLVLSDGDAAKLSLEAAVHIANGRNAEILVFDLPG